MQVPHIWLLPFLLSTVNAHLQCPPNDNFDTPENFRNPSDPTNYALMAWDNTRSDEWTVVAVGYGKATWLKSHHALRLRNPAGDRSLRVCVYTSDDCKHGWCYAVPPKQSCYNTTGNIDIADTNKVFVRLEPCYFTK